MEPKPGAEAVEPAAETVERRAARALSDGALVERLRRMADHTLHEPRLAALLREAATRIEGKTP